MPPRSAPPTRPTHRRDGCAARGGTRPFDVEAVVASLRIAVRSLADAAMFALRDQGYGSVFQQLVACILSIRTRDEVSLPVALALLGRAPTPRAMARLGVDGIDALIGASAFHDAKARQIHAIAERTAAEFGEDLPPDAALLTSFHGVGPKCANLALGVATGAGGIAVDIHVHRVTNRWGQVCTTTPEGTMRALEAVLPRAYWVEINRLLVPFGKHVCTGVRPRCSTCPLLAWCRQVGVTECR